jgi:peptidyl-tRNA hydrolase
MSSKLYVIVNADLNMNPGKMASQVGHAVTNIIRYLEHTKDPTETKIYQQWLHKDNEPIIVLGIDRFTIVSEESMNAMKGLYFTIIEDYDLDATTAIGFVPLLPEQVPDIIKNLKLL